MGDNLGPNGLSRGCKVLCFQVDVAEIVADEADDPNAVVAAARLVSGPREHAVDVLDAASRRDMLRARGMAACEAFFDECRYEGESSSQLLLQVDNHLGEIAGFEVFEEALGQRNDLASPIRILEIQHQYIMRAIIEVPNQFYQAAVLRERSDVLEKPFDECGI